MTPPTKGQLDEIRRRLLAGTRGPWAENGDRVESLADHGVVNDGWIICDCEGPDRNANAAAIVAARNLLPALLPHECIRSKEQQSRADAAFIAHARTDIPRLLEYVDELRAALKRLLMERAERGGRQHSSTCAGGDCRYCQARAALGDAP